MKYKGHDFELKYEKRSGIIKIECTCCKIPASYAISTMHLSDAIGRQKGLVLADKFGIPEVYADLLTTAIREQKKRALQNFTIVRGNYKGYMNKENLEVWLTNAVRDARVFRHVDIIVCDGKYVDKNKLRIKI